MLKVLPLLMMLNLSSVFAQDTTNSDSAQRSLKENLCDIEALKSYNPIRGTIPLTFGHLPSTDLLCDSDECGDGFQKGDVLSPKQAFEYYQRRFEETRCQWTLSDLDPAEEPSIWKNTLGGGIDPKLDDLDLNDLDKVQFISKGWARLGSYRATVNKNNSYGTPIQYTVILAKNIHNYLLRKTLLRKLGYFVPPVKHVKRLKVSFKSKKERDQFIKDLTVNNAGSEDRWVISKKRKEIVIQDIVVMEDQEFNLNLAKGFISPDIFQGKRVYDSLIIPYALTNILESINLTDWTVGRVYSENVVLNYNADEAKNFSTSKDDAVWMVRRLMKLTEKDWQEIVDSTALPPSVKVLLLEKLKSRRNHLGELFNVQNENFKVDHLISNHNDLVNGKLTVEIYDGYARRFKIPDPDSPLAFSEMFSFFRAKARSIGLELLVNLFNSWDGLGTDIAGNIEDFYTKLSEDLASSIASDGENSNRLPVKAFAFPTVKGTLIVNRDIVTGAYLGTDNLIQLVDTVGASVSVGAFGGISGVYSKTGQLKPISATEIARQFVPVDLSGNANLFVNRTYSHIKPITSVQKALKYKYSNLLVPMLKNSQGHYFDSVMTAEYDLYSEEEKLKANKNSYNKLLNLLGDIRKDLYRFPIKARLKNVEDALNKAKSTLEDNKELYINTVTKASDLSPILADLNKFQKTFSSNYLITDSCRENVIESYNRFFSLVEVDVKETDSITGEEIVTGTKKLICASNKKGKASKKIKSMIQSIEMLITEGTYQTYRLSKKQRDYEMEQVTKLLEKNLDIGESLIVQDTIGGSLTASVGLDLYNVAKVRASVKPNKLVVSRLHILRKSETEIHVYKDLGNVNGIELSLGVEKFVPIMKITLKNIKGTGRTKFYNVDIGKYARIVKDRNGKIDEERSVLKPNRLEKMRGLRRAFLTGSVKGIEKVQKPFVVKHKFKERNAKLGVLVYRWNWLKQSDKMEIITPKGHSKKVYRQVKGYTKGRDFENYARDLVDLIFAKLTSGDSSVSSFNEGNPGYTFMGRAQNRITSYEGIVDKNGKVDQPYTKVTRIWNGWKMKKEKALETLRQIKEKYGFKFFEEAVLTQTKEIFLYNINVNFYIYNKGLSRMLDIKKSELKEIWKTTQSRDMTNFTGDDSLAMSGFKKFLRLRRRYSKYLLKNKQDKAARMIIKMVETMESKLKLEGMSKILGGKHNFFAIARIDGFRVGDENGDKKILSNSFGRLGTEDLEGPLNRLRRFIGMTNGEFFMNWLLGRVI